MNLKSTSILIVIVAFLISCEKDDEQYKPYNEVLLKEIIRNSETESILDYNLSGQVIKKTFRESVYFLYDYNSLGKLIKISMYNGPERPEYEDELASYDTIIYETNKIIEKHYGVAGSFELGYYKEYILNSNNECIKLIIYDDADNEIESTVITWSKRNIIEYTTTYSDGSWRNGKYEHDNEYNPYTFCSNIIEPWSLSKNNLTRAIIHKSYTDLVDTIVCNYTYNDYGFAINQEIYSEVLDMEINYEFIYDIN